MPISSTCNTCTLTSAELGELLERAQRQGESIFQQTESELRIELPKALGEGGDRIIHLRGGLTLLVRNATLRRTTRMEQQHPSDFPLTAKFYLSGSSRVQTQSIAGGSSIAGVRAEYEERAGCHYLYHLPDLIEIEEWYAQKPTQVVMIYAEASYFQNFNLNENLLPGPLQSFMQAKKERSDSARRFHQSLGKVTPAMHQLLQQILHCPYQGLMQQFYLESKALELLTLQFDCWKASGALAGQTASTKELLLRSDDLERLYQAREILVERSAEPPSLVELARQVGLNDRKLKQGFRHLFGTTVFGYLQDYRMQQAKRLLHDSDLSIASVATTVGYKNPEAFSTAFRRKFAVSPKSYQIGQRS